MLFCLRFPGGKNGIAEEERNKPDPGEQLGKDKDVTVTCVSQWFFFAYSLQLSLLAVAFIQLKKYEIQIGAFSYTYNCCFL